MQHTIQQAMRRVFPEADPRVRQFYAMQEYHLGWRNAALQPANFDPGKLLRPQLALLACRAVGGDTLQALPLAAAVQLIHDFTLIHDDIEDNSDTRRGRVTVWKEWGLAQGVNTGDGMFVLAHLALHGLSTIGVPAERVLNITRRFDEIILMVCEGQFLDLSYEGDLTISVDDYLAMIGRKTAALVAGATELGAIVGGGGHETAAAFARFGRSIGLAFQIQDDVLGIWGDPELTGKPRAADLYRRKVSLPVVHALHQADDRTALAQIYAAGTGDLDDAAVGQALAVLDATGSRRYSEAIAAEHHAAALAALDAVQVGDTPDAQAALATIRTIVEKLVGREV